jgi:hypothetical protein
MEQVLRFALNAKLDGIKNCRANYHVSTAILVNVFSRVLDTFVAKDVNEVSLKFRSLTRGSVMFVLKDTCRIQAVIRVSSVVLVPKAHAVMPEILLAHLVI